MPPLPASDATEVLACFPSTCHLVLLHCYGSTTVSPHISPGPVEVPLCLLLQHLGCAGRIMSLSQLPSYVPLYGCRSPPQARAGPFSTPTSNTASLNQVPKTSSYFSPRWQWGSETHCMPPALQEPGRPRTALRSSSHSFLHPAWMASSRAWRKT